MADGNTPLKGVAWNLGFSLYKADGTLIANPGTYTKKVWKDGGAAADIAGSVTETDTTYGQLVVQLSTSEMNADYVQVYIKDDTVGCVPFTATIYPSAGNAYAEAALVHTHAATIESDVAAVHAHVNDLHDTDLPAVKAETALIVADTGELQTDWAQDGRLDLLLDAVNTDTDTIIAALPTVSYRFIIKT